MSKKHLLSVVNINIEDFEKAKKGNEYMGDVFVIFKVVTKSVTTDFLTFVLNVWFCDRICKFKA